MSVTGLSKGLSQVGRYILNQKQQQREAQNRFALENLKNEMWKRRLREETLRQQQQRDFLLNKYQKEQEEMTKREQIKGAADLVKFNRIKDIEERRVKLQEEANRIADKKANADISRENRLNLEKKQRKLLDDIRGLDIQHDNLVGQLENYEETTFDPETGAPITTKGKKWYGRNEKGLANIEELMNQKVYELMGQKPPLSNKDKYRDPYTIDPNDKADLRRYIK